MKEKEHLRDETALLEEVLIDASAVNGARAVEANVDVLAEARAIVVAHSARVAERFEDRVRLKHLLLDPRVLPAERREVLQQELRALRLSCTRIQYRWRCNLEEDVGEWAGATDRTGQEEVRT